MKRKVSVGVEMEMRSLLTKQLAKRKKRKTRRQKLTVTPKAKRQTNKDLARADVEKDEF